MSRNLFCNDPITQYGYYNFVQDTLDALQEDDKIVVLPLYVGLTHKNID